MPATAQTLPRPSPEFPLYDAEDAFSDHIQETRQGVSDDTIGTDLRLLMRKGAELAEFAAAMADAPRHSYWIDERPTAERLVELIADVLDEAYGTKGAEVVRKAARLRLAQAERVQG